MTTVTTSTGVVLDPSHDWAKTATKYGRQLGLGVTVCLATHTSGEQEYVVLDKDLQPVYANSNYEALGTWLVMAAKAEGML